jgi:hypothetical protein
MKLHYLAILAGLPLAGVAAWQLGGAQGAGLMLGCAAAIGIGVWALLWQEHLLRTRPKFALNAMLIGFLAKLAALLAGSIALRFLEPAARVADWSTFLIGFAVASLWVMTLGSLRILRALSTNKEPRAS